jgi:hypothetical protein
MKNFGGGGWFAQITSPVDRQLKTQIENALKLMKK